VNGKTIIQPHSTLHFSPFTIHYSLFTIHQIRKKMTNQKIKLTSMVKAAG